jgi:hypothetical protein
MLYFLISMLIMLVLLDRALRIGRQETLLCATRFKLFELRDELRMAAIDETIPQNQWFEYLDTTLTKAIDKLPRFTAWEAFALYVSHRHDPGLIAAVRHLDEALRQPENEGLQRFYNKFVFRLIEFLFERHIITSYTMLGVANVGIGVLTLRDRLVKILTAAPETSTLQEYAFTSSSNVRAEVGLDAQLVH